MDSIKYLKSVVTNFLLAPIALNLHTEYILLLAVFNQSVIRTWNFNLSSTITPRYLTLED